MKECRIDAIGLVFICLFWWVISFLLSRRAIPWWGRKHEMGVHRAWLEIDELSICTVHGLNSFFHDLSGLLLVYHSMININSFVNCLGIRML